MLKGLALQVFHHDEGLAFTLVNVVNGANVGMVQGGGSTGFPLEAFEGDGGSLLVLRSTQHLLGKELEGYKGAEAKILGLVDHTHAPAAELFENAIVADGTADHGWKPAFNQILVSPL